MQQDIVTQLHGEKYFSSMSFEEYTNIVNHGLQLICDKGLSVEDGFDRKAVNLALEYNEALVVHLLGVDVLINTDFTLS